MARAERLGPGRVAGSAIHFDRVSRRYDSLLAVDDVSLQVDAGEFLTLLGPSGSGKTTLLMMLAGFDAPSSGRIRIDDRDITDVPANKRGIGMVFQRYALFPHLTVAQNIAFPLRMRRVPKREIREKVEGILGLVQLEGYQSRFPSQLSGGQQQRVAVARALVYSPSVLLMDEPLGALDKKLREQMQVEIKKLHQTLGLTFIYVTHDQDEALSMSDRVAVVHCGRLAQVASPLDLYMRPQDTFVADFVGKMNFLDATVAEMAADAVLVEIAGGHKIRAARTPAHDLLEKGTAVRVGVRPEHLMLKEASAGGADALFGRIQTTVFLGAAQAVVVGLQDTALNVHLHTGMDRLSFAEGDVVQVSCDPASVHLFRR